MDKLVLLLFVLATVLIARKGKIHSIGIWAFVLVAHGMLVFLFGPGLQKMAMIIGLVAVPISIMWDRGLKPDLASAALILSFLLVILASLILGSGFDDSLSKIEVYMKPLVVCLFFSSAVKSPTNLRVVSYYILAAAVAGSLFNCYQQFTGTQVISNQWDKTLSRAASLRGDPNDTAMLLLATLPLAYVNAINGKTWLIKLLFLCVAGTIAIGVVLTGSRAGFVVLLLIMVAVMLHKPKSIKPNLVNLPSIRNLALVVFFLFVSVVAAPGYYWERMSTLVTWQEVGSSNSLYDRKMLLEKGFDAWFKNPVLGVGPGQFHYALYGKTLDEVSASGKSIVAHNMYLEFLVEFGILGLITFMTTAIVSIYRLLKMDFACFGLGHSNYIGYGYALGLGAMLVMGATLSQGYNSVLWLYLGCGLGCQFRRVAEYRSLTSSSFSFI